MVKKSVKRRSTSRPKPGSIRYAHQTLLSIFAFTREYFQDKIGPEYYLRYREKGTNTIVVGFGEDAFYELTIRKLDKKPRGF